MLPSQAVISIVLIGLLPVVFSQVILQLKCGSYPDVYFYLFYSPRRTLLMASILISNRCDNHCNAFSCYGMAGIVLHRDITADAGTNKERRAAIGCGPNNYCPSSTDCDEFPYASTYDGGLGVSVLSIAGPQGMSACWDQRISTQCYPDGYDGSDHLQLSGTTRCGDPSQNRRELFSVVADSYLK